MKSLGTGELEATLASLRQLRDRFASAEAWSAVRKIDLTIQEAEAELTLRREDQRSKAQ